MKNESDSIIDELDSRLDDFFAEDISPAISSSGPEKKKAVAEKAKKKVPTTTGVESQRNSLSDNPLNTLKAIVLEMDWEISDDNLSNYINEISRLMNIYSNDKVLFLFFKLHNSIGKYLISKKAAAHPDSIKFLHSVFSSLEKVINTPNISGKERNDLVLNEVQNFKKLKAQIIPSRVMSRKVAAQPTKGNTSAMQAELQVKSPVLDGIPDKVKSELIRYIRDLVKSEVALLKNKG